MSVAAAAQLVGNTLYFKRFFPYYSFTLVAGLDTEGGVFSPSECAVGMDNELMHCTACPMLKLSGIIWSLSISIPTLIKERLLAES